MNQLNRCQPLLGTFVDLRLCADETDARLLQLSESLFSEIMRIHELMSFHDVSSELSYINRNAYKKSCQLSEDMRIVLELALYLSRQSKGLFDITVAASLIRIGWLPAIANIDEYIGDWRDIVLEDGYIRFKRKLLIDLGGIAKGYAVDCGLAKIPEDIDAVVNAGGDLAMTSWQEESVFIKNPNKTTLGHHMKMLAPCLATSALKNPLKQEIITKQERSSVEKPLSVSVFADKCIVADALTKVIFLDVNNTSLIKRFSAQAIYIDQSGSLHDIK